MRGSYQNVKVCGIACAVPTEIEDNSAYFEALGEKRVKKYSRMTGIEQRRICKMGQNALDLSASAADTLLDQLNWERDSIKVLIFVTQAPSFVIPSTAFVIQKFLKLSTDCLVFDVNLGCSGYVAGLQIVASLLQGQEEGARGLLLTGDFTDIKASERNDLTADAKASMMLFGSAGSATGLEICSGNTINFMEESDGYNYQALIRRFGQDATMDGVKVFDFSINEVPESMMKFKDYFGIKENQIDFYIFHQAQKLILSNIGKICDISPEKILMSMQKYGNTTSTSIPLTICHEYKKIQEKAKRSLYLCGFGVGLAWGSVYFTMNTNLILPIIETDHWWGER